MAEESNIVIGAVGDLLLFGRYDGWIKSGEADNIFADVRDVFNNCDVVVQLAVHPYS